MKKVFLYAYDRINLGDDLFIHTITKRYPDAKFYLLSMKENVRTFSSLPNLKVIDQNSEFLKVLGKIRASFPPRYKAMLEKRCDAVVYIGGSLFIEYDNWNQILNWWEYEAENRPFYVLGANFGPYQTEAYRERLDNIFEKMNDVCFRDRYSLEKFKDNSVVRCAPDILFSLDIPAVGKVKKQIFFSVIDVVSKDEGNNRLSSYEEKYLKVLLSLAEKYIEEGYRIVLSSFCKTEGDEKAIAKIIGRLSESSKEYVDVVNYNGMNSEDILKEIAMSEAVIASRFHAAILGVVAGRSVFPIVYSDKTIHVLEDMSFQGAYADIRNLDAIDLEQVLRDLNNKEVTYPMRELQEAAQGHFVKLDEVLLK